MAAQHVTAATPFIHFSSARLRNEALGEVNQIHEDMSRLMVALVTARRQEAKNIALELAATRAQLAVASASAARVQEDLMDQQNAAAAKDELIAHLRSVVASLST